MCIIAVKPSGVDTPDKQTMLNCFSGNSDGAGIAVLRDGIITVKKGFMKFKHFWKEYERLNIKNDEAAIMHFRIATHGGVTPANCHPFPLSQKVHELSSTDIKYDSVMAHNGTMDITVTNGMSDTMTFVRDILSQDVIKNNLDDMAIINLIKKSTSSSRMAILFSNGKFHLYGSSWVENDGMLYSNSGFKHQYITRFNHHNTYYGGDSWWDDDELMFNRSTQTPITQGGSTPSVTYGNVRSNVTEEEILKFTTSKFEHGICPFCFGSKVDIDIKEDFAYCDSCQQWWDCSMYTSMLNYEIAKTEKLKK